MSLFNSPPKRTTRAGVKPILPSRKRVVSKENSTMPNETFSVPPVGGSASNDAASGTQFTASAEATEQNVYANPNNSPLAGNPRTEPPINNWFDPTMGRGRGSRSDTPSVGTVPRQTPDLGQAWSQVDAHIDSRMEQIIRELNRQRMASSSNAVPRGTNISVDATAQGNTENTTSTAGNRTNQNFSSVNHEQTDSELESYRQQQSTNEPREFRSRLSNPSGAFAAFPREYPRSNADNARTQSNLARDDPYGVRPDRRINHSVRVSEPSYNRQTADAYTERHTTRNAELNPSLIKLLAFRISNEGERLEDELFVSETEFREIQRQRMEPTRSYYPSTQYYPRHRERQPVLRGALSRRSSDSSDSEDDYSPNNEYRYPRASMDMRASHHYVERPRNNSRLSTREREIDYAMKIGRIVSNWKIVFPKTERDPEQFLLILKDKLSVSGIGKDAFVPCLSNIFEGPYKSWYLINKQNWRSWKDFTRAFRFQWGVKKEDGDLFLEVRDLNLEKGETLAEFACRARIIFERMQHPPSFREQIKQILVKFNPRLTFEVLNLPIHNYDQLLHYINERSYVYRRSLDAKKDTRNKTLRPEMKYIQGDETDGFDDSETSQDSDGSEQTADLNVIQNKATRRDKRDSSNNSNSASKSLNKQRLDNNLAQYGKSNQATANNSNSQPKDRQTKPNFDPSKFFCFNCGETGHTSAYCRNDRRIVCCVCRKKGHEAAKCPSRAGNEQALA